ncbi:hypothetical protein [Halorhabdus rudnickae]|uniref:hypothetical protein n=1 Tax=Halorhabdus rudnickae TaxID=1775544 RepID=UPI001FCEE18F|nr:hypothetical protein [Halorhabdus rudnickae]
MTQPDDVSPDIPTDVQDALDDSSDQQLREIIHDAQARLEAHHPLTEEVQLQEGESFVRDEGELDETIQQALETSADSELGELIDYARHRLEARPPLTDVVEARENEELVRIDDHGSYSTVVVERPAEVGGARGPFAYMVQ